MNEFTHEYSSFYGEVKCKIVIDKPDSASGFVTLAEGGIYTVVKESSLRKIKTGQEKTEQEKFTELFRNANEHNIYDALKQAGVYLSPLFEDEK